jgi:hypothetical protein
LQNIDHCPLPPIIPILQTKSIRNDLNSTKMKKEYRIKIGYVDNRLMIFLNREMIWDNGIDHDDPKLHKAVEFTSLLHDQENFPNELIFEGFNDTFNAGGSTGEMNPWHCSYKVLATTLDGQGNVIEEKDLIKPYDEKHFSNPNIRALNNVYGIKRRNGDLKVVSNALSQQFAEEQIINSPNHQFPTLIT